MQDCKQYIEMVYVHDAINAAISKIKPADLQNELKQEMAIVLLEYPCEKIVSINNDGKLIEFAKKVLYNMAFSKTSPFYYKFRKCNNSKALEYLRTLQPLPEIPLSIAIKAGKIIEGREGKMEEHESRLFKKYAELGSCPKVAKYYGIPEQHVKIVVAKVRSELKKKLC